MRIATEGALLGSLIAQGVSPEMVVLSDGAGQFDVFVHALCWLHVERPLARLMPHNEKHRLAIERIRQGIWDLYAGLKAYQQAPSTDGAGRVGKAVRRVGRRTDRLSLDRRGVERDGGGSSAVAAGAGAAGGAVAQQPQRGAHPGLREEAEDQRQHAE